MLKENRNNIRMRWLVVVGLFSYLLPLASYLFTGCARMGTPDGGWYDEHPPRILHTQPADRATNTTSKKITIHFDEYIKIADATENVIVSPPQQEQPDVKAKGKSIVVELKDTLQANTTYTIDFSDAITDFTEDNPLGNYTFTFSTGPQIDTLQLSGYVIQADNLEPVKGILVGIYDDLTDTVFRTKPMQRIARTDSKGHFTIKGVAPGEYRVCALKDADGNFFFSQKSEMFAYSPQTYKPYVRTDVRQDTIWRDNLHIDSIIVENYQHYLPDDIVLLAFQEEQTDRFLLKTDRQDARRINMFFSYGSKELPVIRGLNFQSETAFVIESSAKKDTLTYWLRDTTLVNQDTLRYEMTYEMTDSLGQLVMQTDTIESLPKTPYAKRLKAEQKEYEEWYKQQEKKKKREEAYDSIFPVKSLEINYKVPSSISPDQTLWIESPTPLERLDTAGIRLSVMVDSLWMPAPYHLLPTEGNRRIYEVVADWQPANEYQLEVDSAAFIDIYGVASKAYTQKIKVKSLDEYATIFVHISGTQDSSILVQLIDKSDKKVKQAKCDKDRVAQFYYVTPGTYHLRAIVDHNDNGIWDTGMYNEGRQAESVYYDSNEVIAKAKWDVTHQWNLTSQPRHQQKPKALIKQKSENKKTVKNRNAERAAQLGIVYPAR